MVSQCGLLASILFFAYFSSLIAGFFLQRLIQKDAQMSSQLTVGEEQDVGQFWLLFLQRLQQASGTERSTLRHIRHMRCIVCQQVLNISIKNLRRS